MNKSEIDELNNAFIEIMGKDTTATRKITKILISGQYSSIEQVIKDNDSNIARDARFYYLISVLTVILSRRKMNENELVLYAPIIALTYMYSTKQPKLFVKKVNKLWIGKGLSKREQQASALIKKLYKNSTATLKKIERGVMKLRIKAKSEIYREIKKDLGKMPTKDLREKLIKQYNSKSRVRAALKTELHAELEQGKLAHAESFGYKYKTWKTRSDNRVRDTEWHNAVKNMKIPIEKEFKARGMKAMFPGDVSLPIGERINCRCYLELSS